MNVTLTKDEVASQLAEKQGITVVQAHQTINNMLEVIQAALIAGRKVEFRGFGSFISKTRSARTGRNPRVPGSTVQIPAKTVVKFKVGSHLSDALNAAAPAA